MVAMTSWWILGSLGMVMVVNCEPFSQFFGAGNTYFATQGDNPFGDFSGFSFNPNGGMQLSSDFQGPFGSETGNIPIYTDGPSQLSIAPQLENDYTTRTRHFANNRPPSRPKNRNPQFRSEPQPSASSVDERLPSSSKPRGTYEEPRLILPKSQPIEIQTGFIPIIKGSSSDQSRNSLASTVIKDIEPPILTASPDALTARPTLLKVSASVVSSSKVPASQGRQNGSTGISNEVRAKARQASFSRFLNFKNDTKPIVTVTSSSSESVVSRVVSRPDSILELQQKELLRLAPTNSASEETKGEVKRTLDINCDGSSDLGWCELGDKYPRKYVNQVISACPDVVERMHVEVPHSFEKLSDISDFKAELDNSSSQRSAKERSSHDAWSWAAYAQQGSLCDSETGFLRPETAKDATGTWNIIIQTDAIKQRVPIEMCRQTNSSCKKMLNCGLKSQCLQKYNYHLLLSLNPTQKHDCPFMKLYRFPSACVCHVE